MDTEFMESGPHKSIDLISIGIVDEGGKEFYRISSEYDPKLANAWVIVNVLPLIGTDQKFPLKSIAADIQKFVTDPKPEFWGYYADYDWVVFCQIFGTMLDLPSGWPMYCKDVKQYASYLGNPQLPSQDSKEHNALADARWTKKAYEYLAIL